MLGVTLFIYLFANFAHDFLEWYKSAMVFWAVEVSFTIQNAIMVSNYKKSFLNENKKNLKITNACRQTSKNTTQHRRYTDK